MKERNAGQYGQDNRMAKREKGKRTYLHPSRQLLAADQIVAQGSLGTLSIGVNPLAKMARGADGPSLEFGL